MLTGSLGEVMKESAQTAMSYLRSQSKLLNLDLSDYSKFDVHIHVPPARRPRTGRARAWQLSRRWRRC